MVNRQTDILFTNLNVIWLLDNTTLFDTSSIDNRLIRIWNHDLLTNIVMITTMANNIQVNCEFHSCFGT